MLLSPEREAARPRPGTAPSTPSCSYLQQEKQQSQLHLSELPDDVLIEILSHVGASYNNNNNNPLRDLSRALCSAPWLRRLSEHAWAATVRRRWPAWAAVADAAREKRTVAAVVEAPAATATNSEACSSWRRQAELFELREREESALAPLHGDAISKTQKVVQPRHRAVLAEWLAEVSWDWSCESTIIYRAVAYLDTYMATVEVQDLSKYQLLGIAALRAAMADKASATRASRARQASIAKMLVERAAVEENAAEREEEAAALELEPASKRQRTKEVEREESPPAAVNEPPSSSSPARDASPDAPVTPDISVDEQEGEGGGEEEVSTSTAATVAATSKGEAAVVPQREDGNEDDDVDKDLDPARFSHISDRAYSPRDVVDATNALTEALAAASAKTASTMTTAAAASTPDAKMFLRSFWYRAVAGGALNSSSETSAAAAAEKMHVYTLASFLLQLSLLDQRFCSDVAPSLRAAAALSLAIEVFFSSSQKKKEENEQVEEEETAPLSPWPACLQRYSGIAPAAVAIQKETLKRIQSEAAAPHLRAVWKAKHAEAELCYPEYKEEWRRALEVMGAASELFLK